MATKSSRAKTTRKGSLRHGSTLLQSQRPRRIEIHLAPPRYTERRRARPGAGIKRARGVMAQ